MIIMIINYKALKMFNFEGNTTLNFLTLCIAKATQGTCSHAIAIEMAHRMRSMKMFGRSSGTATRADYIPH